MPTGRIANPNMNNGRTCPYLAATEFVNVLDIAAMIKKGMTRAPELMTETPITCR